MLLFDADGMGKSSSPYHQKTLRPGTELHELKKNPKSTPGSSKEKISALKSQFEILYASIKIIRNCDQFIYIREDAKHVAVRKSTLFCLYSTLKILCSSVYTFRTTLSTAIRPIVIGFLTLSVSF